jgi:hypothetical protein
LESIFYGVDVGLNRQREQDNSQAIFVYKTDVELDTMSVEYLKEYAKIFHDGWNEVIQNDELNIRLVCVLFSNFFTHFRIVYF